MLKNPWFQAGLDAWSFYVEASTVIALRTITIAAGGAAAEAETRRMVTEKITAGLALQTLALTGGLGDNPHSVMTGVMAHYRPKVRANKRRLSRGQ